MQLELDKVHFPCGSFDLDLDLVTGPSSVGGAPAGLLSVASHCGVLLLDGDEA